MQPSDVCWRNWKTLVEALWCTVVCSSRVLTVVSLLGSPCNHHYHSPQATDNHRLPSTNSPKRHNNRLQITAARLLRSPNNSTESRSRVSVHCIHQTPQPTTNARSIYFSLALSLSLYVSLFHAFSSFRYSVDYSVE
uniref:Putative secreted peptide n=1 Tax=Anopheles braziliensis TaxID=58242 RepID=A0A2M3ZMC4_9DIPT